MKKDKFVLVTAEGEPNIGVINLGGLDMADESKHPDIIKAIEKTLPVVLQEHYDASATVTGISISSCFPIFIKTKAFIDGHKNTINLVLEETWIY